ncbi:DUF6647 family protein [Antarctobacter jejuensis]|uniref:DUF6647 family protein n=1 Tax=Antarctobacter jejuensis TaxID=1439938 RepID=UPI003FD49127
MAFFRRLGAAMCCALFIGQQPFITAPAQADASLIWRDADGLNDLVAHLEGWLDGNSDLPRREGVPEVRIVSQSWAASLVSARRAHQTAQPRGYYDPASRIIYLLQPWSPRDPHDVSVLLHELAHHRQATAGHWYCPGAQELTAYRLQDIWLNDLGLEADVNWIAVVLEAGCTPRDIHPD